MKSQSSRRVIPFAAGFAIVAVLLIAVVSGFPGRSTNSSTGTTGVSSTAAPLSATTTNSSLGLKLALSIGQSTIQQDHGIPINMSVTNTLSTWNNASSSRPRMNVWLTECGFAYAFPLGVGIFAGNLTTLAAES
ncbi:MAG: hypothetical protein ACRD6W_10545, partial [Nitrososphaerales archaeon]